jgi:hypothetical protein
VDCYYGDLCEHTADKLEGLGTILKNMKREVGVCVDLCVCVCVCVCMCVG